MGVLEEGGHHNGPGLALRINEVSAQELELRVECLPWDISDEVAELSQHEGA